MEAGSIFALPDETFSWFVLTLALNVWILSRGLQRGIEITAKIGMALLIGFGLGVVIRTLTLEPDDPVKPSHYPPAA